jgi:hypothetical protein
MLHAPQPDEVPLRYLIRYHVEDDEMSVHVTAPRNSGYQSGDLVKKALVLNPATGAPYAPTDLRPGSVIQVTRLTAFSSINRVFHAMR